MDLAAFLAQLQDRGELPFASPEPLAFQRDAALEQLRLLDERRRLEMAHEPPEFRPDPAIWAARLTARICQFLVFREIPAEQIDADLNAVCPEKAAPGRVYSVDLTLGWLPDLMRRAAAIASADPLVVQLQRLAWEWPLSSAGVGLQITDGGPEPDLEPILANAALLQLYVDRILASGDQTRLHHPVVAAAAQDAALLPDAEDS